MLGMGERKTKSQRLMRPDWPKLADYPEPVQAQAKLGQLKNKLLEVSQEAAEAMRVSATPRTTTVKEDAATLLETGALPGMQTPMHEELTLLRRQRRALEEAITQQERIVKDTIRAAGRDAAERLEGEYAARVQRLHKALGEVLAANDAIRDLQEYCDLQGFECVSGFLYPMQVTWLPRAADPEHEGSFWPVWQREARECGYIE